MRKHLQANENKQKWTEIANTLDYCSITNVNEDF